VLPSTSEYNVLHPIREFPSTDTDTVVAITINYLQVKYYTINYISRYSKLNVRSVYVDDVNNICFYLHSQLLYFLIILFSLHVLASMGHPQVST
jgi:hypothetical protein